MNNGYHIAEPKKGTVVFDGALRRNGVPSSLFYRGRKLTLDAGSIATTEDESATSNKSVREVGTRVTILERQLARKTPEVKILKEALNKSR